jgi:transposase
MEPLPFLPDVPGLLVEQVISGDDALTLVVRLITPALPCPSCGQLATRIHSRYRRTLHDLPVSGRTVRLSLQIRRFFCTHAMRNELLNSSEQA